MESSMGPQGASRIGEDYPSAGQAKEFKDYLSLEQNSSTESECPQNSPSPIKRPSTVAETGLSEALLLQLLLKHLRTEHVATVKLLAKLMALSGGIIQSLLAKAKQLAWVENRPSGVAGQMRYSLSALGISEAENAFAISGYVGKAPIPLALYCQMCTQQSSRGIKVTTSLLLERFSKLLFSQRLIDSIGPALNSVKPILIYGLPGVGKSYLCRHLNLIFGDDVYIPFAIEINNQIIQVYDPQVHHISEKEEAQDTLSPELVALETGYDPRWQLCQRPLIITGGELTEEMLEVNFDPLNKTYKAPLQLKANNGILLLDDLGRQKITPAQLFNRWIIPLEERRDFLTLSNGVHFEIPFELLLLFSTNLNPSELVDDAFLRRLGYKIEFEPLTLEVYRQLWFRCCQEYKLGCEEAVFEYLVEQRHYVAQKPFLPCYPRDLLSIVSDQINYSQSQAVVSQVLIDFAWKQYFVS